MKVYQLVDWMDKLILRVVHADITLADLDEEDRYYDKLLATHETLIAELRVFEGNEPWIIGLELSSGRVVAVPWWYFREVSL